MAVLALQVLSLLLRRLDTLLFGPRHERDRPGPGLPAYIEVREAPARPTAEPEPGPRADTPPPVDLAGMRQVLVCIRRTDRGTDLEQILDSLGQMLPLLHGAAIPAHKLQGLEQSLCQMRAATRDGADAAGFEVNMAQQLLEREVQSVVRHLG